MKNLLKPIILVPAGIILFFLIVFLGYKIRMHFCVEKIKVEMRESNITDEISSEIADKIEHELLSIPELANELRNSRLLLFGEPHLKIEVMEYFTEVLDNLNDNEIVLNIELPPSAQDEIDNYMETGEEKYLDSLALCKTCLPLPAILRWCYKNRERVVKINAVDEEIERIFRKRDCFCMDTRNRTMFHNVFKSYHEYPNARILFYGGQLHTMKSGRYKYDIPNRVSCGSRLIGSSIPDQDIKVIMISGEDDFPLAPAWRNVKGAMDVRDKFFDLPVTYFYTYPLYRLSYAGEMFDFFVNVGQTTMIDF